MIDFISTLAHTLAQANRFLLQELSAMGLDGLATSHGDVLAQLFQSDGLSMCELARRVDRDPSTVTALVRKLVSLGYVATARAEADRRSVVVTLTPQGRALEARFAEISVRLIEIQCAGIDAARVEDARSVLLQMQENFRSACSPDRP